MKALVFSALCATIVALAAPAWAGDLKVGDRNKAFAEAHNADFPLLGDPTKETAMAYGVLSERGRANRWTFYIDKNGTITYIDKDVNGHLATSAEDMAAKLGDLKVPMKKGQ